MEPINRSIQKAIYRGEKLFKTDIRYLASGGFWLGLDQISSSGTSFLISIMFANFLLPDTYGLYKYVISITSLLFITTLSGMDPAMTQSISRGFEGSLITGVKTKIKWSLIGTMISFGIAIYYFIQGNTTLFISFCVVAVFLPFCESFDMYNTILSGKKLFKTQTLYDIGRNAVTLIVLAGVVFLTKKVYLILFAYFITIAIPNCILFFRTIKIHKKNDTIDTEVIHYGKHLSAIYIIGTILGELDKILVFHFVGATDLAVYTLAAAPTDQVKGLLKNLNSLALPRFSQRSSDEIQKTIWHKMFILGISVTTIILVYIIFAPIFFHTFFPKYIASIRYSQILSISLIGAILSGFLYTVLESQKAKKELYKYNIYSNVVNIIVLFPLVYTYGIWGAIASRVITRFFTLTLSIILVKKIT